MTEAEAWAEWHDSQDGRPHSTPMSLSLSAGRVARTRSRLLQWDTDQTLPIQLLRSSKDEDYVSGHEVQRAEFELTHAPPPAIVAHGPFREPPCAGSPLTVPTSPTVRGNLLIIFRQVDGHRWNSIRPRIRLCSNAVQMNVLTCRQIRIPKLVKIIP